MNANKTKPTFHELRILAELPLTDIARDAKVVYNTVSRADAGLKIRERSQFVLVRYLNKILNTSYTVDDVEWEEKRGTTDNDISAHERHTED